MRVIRLVLFDRMSAIDTLYFLIAENRLFPAGGWVGAENPLTFRLTGRV